MVFRQWNNGETMTKSELLEWLDENPTINKDPEIEIWISETEKVRVLSVYTNNKNNKIFIDVELE